MSNRITVLISFLFCIACFASQNIQTSSVRDWENPAVFSRNQEEAHTPLAPFNSVAEALKYDKFTSPWLQSLNGEWKFLWVSTPVEAPADFFQPDYNVGNWQNIKVPGNWQMQGFGHPLFRNVQQPFVSTPPFAPSDYNPVGSYRRTFTIPSSWKGRQVFLHFESVHSASHVWVNGVEAGYNQGGTEPAEYNITSLLQAGENTLSVRVYRYSDGAYLEDQDMWRLSGIYRNVYLYATPDVHIRDFFIWPDLDKNYKDGLLKVTVEVKNFSAQSVAGYSVRLNLYNNAGEPVLSKPLLSPFIAVAPGEVTEVKLAETVSNPAKWSAEYPNLYHVTLELLDAAGNVTETLGSRTGFRKVEVKNRAICINGVAVKFNGVNSHVHHPVTGRTMDVETMRKDLTLMKQFNINCVRTSHYPPNNEYLDLADELGMYIIDETGDEAHSTEYISEDPAWRAAYMDRGKRMVKRDRNHPSVVIWSAGNESGSGENIGAIIAQGKQLDPSRPNWLYGGNTDLLPFEDIVGPRYPTPDELEKVGQVPATVDARPSFMDEYLAASGNSLGNLEEYWELIYRYPRLTGGAIWDWMSPGILSKIISTPDLSKYGNKGYLLGRACLVEGIEGNAVSLSGHDDWVEIYRHPVLNITGNKLTLEAWIYPRNWNGAAPFITKGNHQYGLLQAGKRTLEFYIQDGERIVVRADVPEDWEFKWHHIAGVYDGAALKLYIDGQEKAVTPHSGSIDYGYYPVAIGKNAELHGQEHPGQICNSVIDNVRIYAKALAPAELGSVDENMLKDALLCLNFDSTTEEGNFYFLGIGARPYGLVWPDRTVQPELWQLKKTPQPVKVEAVNLLQGKVKITNRYNFTNLKELVTSWSLMTDDKPIQSGLLNLDIPAGETIEITIPYNLPAAKAGEEYRLAFSFTLAKETTWAPKGHEVAWEQLEIALPTPARTVVSTEKLPPLNLDESYQFINIYGKDFFYTFDKDLGKMTSILFRGKELLKDGPALSVWRAPVWNETERDWGQTPIVNQWRAAGLDRLQHKVVNVAVNRSGDAITMVVETIVGPPENAALFACKYAYTFIRTGDILITQHITPRGKMPDWLPRLGLQLVLNKEFDQFTWYGRGPIETYPDRKTGAKIGVYNGSAQEQYTPYLVPGDYGNKTDVRWAALTNKSGMGLFVAGAERLNVSAQHFSTENLSLALYPFQLTPQDGITLNIDYLVSGVGCTAVKSMAKYQVQAKEVEYSIRLRPFATTDQPPVELAKQAVK